MPRHRALAVAVLVLLCGSCSGSRGATDQQQSSQAGIANALSASAADPAEPSGPATGASSEGTLPPGALVELVPSATELPAGFTITADAAGPADLAAVADRSTDPEAAQKSLKSAGFKVGYSADYGNEQTGGFVSVLVLQFANATGARAAYAQQVRAAAEVAEPRKGATVGDESAAFRESVPEGDVAEIESIHFRVRELVWVVETGGQDGAETSMALDIAMKLVKRTA